MLRLENERQAKAINALYRELEAAVKRDIGLLSAWKNLAMQKRPGLEGLSALEEWLVDYQQQPRWKPWYKPWCWHWFDGVPYQKLVAAVATERMLESLRGWEQSGRSSVSLLLINLEKYGKKVSYFSWVGMRLRGILRVFGWGKEKIRKEAMQSEEELVSPVELKRNLDAIYVETLQALKKFGKKKEDEKTHAEYAKTQGLTSKEQCKAIKISVEKRAAENGRNGWLGIKNKDKKLIILRRHVYYRLLEELLQRERQESDWNTLGQLVIEGKKLREKDDSEVFRVIDKLGSELIKLSDRALKKVSEGTKEDWDKELLFLLTVGKELWEMDKWRLKLLKSNLQEPLKINVPMDWRINLERSLKVKVNQVEALRKEIKKIAWDGQFEIKIMELEEQLTKYAMSKNSTEVMDHEKDFETLREEIAKLTLKAADPTRKPIKKSDAGEEGEMIKVTPQVRKLCKLLSLELSREEVGWQEIRSAYKRKALKLHPDKLKDQNNREGMEKFLKMSAAFQELEVIKGKSTMGVQRKDKLEEEMMRWHEEFKKALAELEQRQREELRKFSECLKEQQDELIEEHKQWFNKQLDDQKKMTTGNAKEIEKLKTIVGELVQRLDGDTTKDKRKEDEEKEKFVPEESELNSHFSNSI